VTAIGLAVLHTDDIELGNPGKNGTEWISNIECFNIQPRETGHQKNDNKHFKNKPEDFQFEREEWLLKADTPKLFKDVLEDFEGPVILICHDTGGDIKDIREELGFDVDRSTKHVSILDSQVMARARKFPHRVGLKALTSALGISGVVFHNGGNDAALTLIDSILMAIAHSQDFVEATANTVLLDGPNDAESSDENATTLPPPTVQDVVDMLRSRPHRSEALFGSFFHCTRCNGFNHVRENCHGTVDCYRCHGKGHTTVLCMCPDKFLEKTVKKNIARFGNVEARQYPGRR